MSTMAVKRRDGEIDLDSKNYEALDTDASNYKEMYQDIQDLPPWNLPEITVVLQLFQHYFGITDKSRKTRIFYRFFDLWPWSRNNYVMIPTTW